jgi:tRNA(Arg) A34 adenosine deaminase TadA
MMNFSDIIRIINYLIMKRILPVIFSIVFAAYACAQKTALPVDSIPPGYFVTNSRAELMKKLSDLPLGVKITDSIPVIIQKVEKFLRTYQPQKKYADDVYAKEAVFQAFLGFKEGGYGIGAVLVDSKGNIIFKDHNSQIQKHRSDLHAEMTLLTDFEESPISQQFMNLYVYKPGLVVYSSAEPCPMCFIRLASARVNTKYCCPGPDDGMANRIDCLPSSWRDLTRRYPCKKDSSSPLLQKISHLMFFSYLLDNRGPK